MKSFKQILVLVLALVSLFTLSLTLGACDDKNPPDEPCNHTYGEWETTKNADCTEQGEKKQTCTLCGNVKTEKITALGHTAPNGEGKCDRCGTTVGDATQNATYTVTVKDSAGQAIVGAKVQLFEQTLGTVDKNTGNDGKVSFEVPKDTMFAFVKLLSLPEGYKLVGNEDTVVLGGDKEIIIQNIEKLTLYQLIIVDASNNAVEGVRAQICVGDNCNPGVSDENGVISVYLSEKDLTEGVKASITDDNYVSATAGREYEYYPANDTTLTITVAAV